MNQREALRLRTSSIDEKNKKFNKISLTPHNNRPDKDKREEDRGLSEGVEAPAGDLNVTIPRNKKPASGVGGS